MRYLYLCNRLKSKMFGITSWWSRGSGCPSQNGRTCKDRRPACKTHRPCVCTARVDWEDFLVNAPFCSPIWIKLPFLPFALAPGTEHSLFAGKLLPLIVIDRWWESELCVSLSWAHLSGYLITCSDRGHRPDFLASHLLWTGVNSFRSNFPLVWRLGIHWI